MNINELNKQDNTNRQRAIMNDKFLQIQLKHPYATLTESTDGTLNILIKGDE